MHNAKTPLIAHWSEHHANDEMTVSLPDRALTPPGHSVPTDQIILEGSKRVYKMNQNFANKTRPQVIVLSNAGLAFFAEARPFRKTKKCAERQLPIYPTVLTFLQRP